MNDTVSPGSSLAPPLEEPVKPLFRLPDTYVILLVFIALAALATWIVPAGEYQRIPGPDGRTTIDPASFRQVEAKPIGLEGFMLAIPKGLTSASSVVFFTLIIGGLFMVIRRTGLIEIGVAHLTRKFSQGSLAVIPVLMVVFALVATLIGTQELALVYVPVILPLMIALRFDSMTAAAVALCATTAGFMAGVLNPINTGLGQQLAGLEVYSGLGVRVIALLLMLAAAALYVTRYAWKIRRNPAASLVYEADRSKRERYQQPGQLGEGPRMSGRQRAAVLATLGFFGLLVYGVLARDWFMNEMSGLFIVMGIVVGLIAGLKGDEICEGFNEGFRDVLVGAMIPGVARAVAVMLEEGRIMDTFVHALGELVGAVPSTLSAIGMLFAQLGISFVVSSGSGQALVTMPIMAPLSDVVGVTRQTAVLAYQLGDGLSNILYPTSGYFMATLAVAGVPWQQWLRFFLPLFCSWAAIAVGFMIYAQVTHWVG